MPNRTLAAALLAAVLSACAPPIQVVEVMPRPRSTEGARSASPDKPAVDPYAGIASGRFDGGKMWTFDDPPLDYFEEAYGFRPDSAWMAKARGAALRFADYCSASFVSPSGLVMTNHHCARESVSKVSREGEALLDRGFYAASTGEERRVKNLFVEMLVSIRDVTAEVAGARPSGSESATAARERRAEALQKRYTAEAQATDSTLRVQLIPLYNGGRYAAYTFRKYEDVRLVWAPEVRIGFFGGDWDNFTYPRYNLDAAFFRVYGDDGRPVQPLHHFAWDVSGAEDGEAVFVVGNPGTTSRLATVSQLEYARDHELPLSLALLARRADLLAAYIAEYPEEAEKRDLRNSYFSIRNSMKSMQGQLDGLRSDWLIPRRGAAERELQRSIAANDSLRKLYGRVLGDLESIQRSKEASIGAASAFGFFLNPSMSSHVLARAMYGYVYTLLRQRGAPKDQLQQIRDEALKIEDWPRELDARFLALRLADLKESLGDADPTMRRLLAGRTPEEVAREVVDSTALADSAAFVALLDKNYLTSGDASVPLIEAIAPLYFTLNQQLESFQEREADLNASLARARFAIEGTRNPPDASFSLRLSDGVVAGYDYNGTRAPAFTTYFGLYERYEAGANPEDWLLPERWQTRPATFDLRTPINLVSTNDISGGNSGSPLLDRDLRVVGLVFDSNMEALPNEFIYADRGARTVSVDARGIIEALDELYDADRIVAELLTGTLYETEEEADAVAAGGG